MCVLATEKNKVVVSLTLTTLMSYINEISLLDLESGFSACLTIATANIMTEAGHYEWDFQFDGMGSVVSCGDDSDNVRAYGDNGDYGDWKGFQLAVNQTL